MTDTTDKSRRAQKAPLPPEVLADALHDKAVADSWRAEVARLTAELREAKINAGNFAVLDAGQPISDAVPTYEAMAAELAAARENEARYLWLRDTALYAEVCTIMDDGPEHIDASIDAARRAGEGEERATIRGVDLARYACWCCCGCLWACSPATC